MFDIVLVNPVKIRDSYSVLPLGTLTLGTILKNNGFSVLILDFNYLWEKGLLQKGEDIETTLNLMSSYLLELKPGIIGFSTNSSCHHVAIALSEQIKARSSIKIIFGGHQASLTAVETMTKYPWIDLISVGEGENNIVPIVLALSQGKSVKNIKGIVYRRENEVIKNEDIELLEDLDKLPMLDYSLTNLDLELKKSSNIAFPIEVGRSCPFSCTFCCTKTFWKHKFRMKSTPRLLAEIEYIISNYSVSSFHFLHDLFTYNKSKVLEFCNLVAAKGLKFKWICSARVDTLDEEMIKAMKAAGCEKIFLGIETASTDLQKSIRKNLKISAIWEKVKLLKDYGIKAEAGFMYGFPEETEEDVNLTLNMMMKGARMGVWFPEIGILNVENGTEIYYNIREKLYFSQDLDNIYLCGKEETEYFYSSFKENPELYPHFYDFDNKTRQKYKYLDKFMWILITLMFLGLRTTISFLIAVYKNNILNLYLDMTDTCADAFKEIFVENFAVAKGNETALIDRRISLLEKLLLLVKDKKENGAILYQLFDLERNIIHLRVFGKLNDKIQLQYDYNLLQLKQSGTIDDSVKTFAIRLNKISESKIEICGEV